MKEYQLEWEIEPRDFHVISLKKNVSFWICALIFSALSAVLIWDAFFLSFSLPLQILASLLSMALCAVLFYWFIVGVQKLNLKRQPELLGLVRLTINQDGIRMGDEENFLKLPWERIRKVEESKDYLLIQTKKKEKMILPKRCFQNAEEEEACISFIKNHL